MGTDLVFTGVIFAALCVVCVLGGVNIARGSHLGDKERLGHLLKAALIVGLMTFGLGWFLFSPGHNQRMAQIIGLVALALNAAYWFSRAFESRRTPRSGEEDTPQSLSK